MIEPDFVYTLTGSDIELIEFVRLAHMGDFGMSMTRLDGGFTIKLTNLDAGQFLEGHGATFEACWRTLFSSDLRGMDLNLEERIAARGVKVPDRLQIVGGTAA